MARESICRERKLFLSTDISVIESNLKVLLCSIYVTEDTETLSPVRSSQSLHSRSTSRPNVISMDIL